MVGAQSHTVPIYRLQGITDSQQHFWTKVWVDSTHTWEWGTSVGKLLTKKIHVASKFWTAFSCLKHKEPNVSLLCPGHYQTEIVTSLRQSPFTINVELSGHGWVVTANIIDHIPFLFILKIHNKTVLRIECHARVTISFLNSISNLFIYIFKNW